MTRVLLGLGSNDNPVDNLGFALDSLLLKFKDLALSPVFESDPVGAETGAAPYLNLVVSVETVMSVQELQELCKTLEVKLGRQRSGAGLGVPLDIDILIYGKQVGRVSGVNLPRAELTEAAYVLWPAAVLVPKERHPALKQTYAQLWAEFDRSQQRIAPVNFFWHERQISSAALK